ncbi:MAG: LacI family DNA-binding transcriptional regulator [Trueperaceae bacterium]
MAQQRNGSVPAMKQRRPTQIDVAKLAGVSTAVVSKVLNPDSRGTVRVSDETESRVLRAIAQLGYVPNPVARNLAMGRTRLLGVFSFESIFPVAQRDFYFPFLLGIEQEAEAKGFDLLLFTSASRLGRPRSIFLDGVNRLQMADGGILLGRQPPKHELAQLASSGYPFICVGRREVPGTSVSYVAADYSGATAEIISHLVELGHRRIAYIGGPEADESAADRESGYLTSMRNFGLEGQSSVLRTSEGALEVNIVAKLYDDQVTAVLLETDDLARRFEELARDQGIQLPDQLSFAVLGDPLNPATGDPDWTSFTIPREAMGRRSLATLLTLLDGTAQAPQRFVLPCTFEPGSSTASPRVTTSHFERRNLSEQR